MFLIQSFSYLCTMNIFGWIFVCFCGNADLVFGKIQIGPQGSRPATFERFDGSCPGRKSPIIFTLHGARIEGTKLRMNTTFNVKEDILGNPTMTLSLTKCKSKENPDTCEKFHDFKTDNYCSMVDTESDLWSPFYGTYKPPLKCPFKKGVYRGTDSVIDMRAFFALTRDDWFWKTHAELRDKQTNRALACISAEVLITTAGAMNQADLRRVVGS